MALIAAIAPVAFGATAPFASKSRSLTLDALGTADALSLALSTSRLVNASVRAPAAPNSGILIAGFVVSGTGNKPVLIRSVGPTLSAFGITDSLADPEVQLHDQVASSVLDQDRGWGKCANAKDIATVSARLGAFPLPANSADSALLRVLAPGAYTATVNGESGDSGVALLEVYDAAPGRSSRLVNLSARARTGTGDGQLILGFVLSGDGPRQLLIRGVGPTLGKYGLTDFVRDPQLELRDAHGNLLASNDDWSADPAIAKSAASVGAFALPSGSKDAALIATLPPGVYTAQVHGKDDKTGVMLAELYEVPPPDTPAEWTMVNVSPHAEQADCHLLQFPDGRNVLIDIADAADAPGTALAYLQAHHITAVDQIVLTHFHRDHYGRLRDLVDSGIKVRRVIYNIPAPEDNLADAEAPWGFWRDDANNTIQYLRDHQIDCYTPHAGNRLVDLRLPDGTPSLLEVVCLYDGAHTPIGKTDTNDTSIIVRLTHEHTRVLFTGDLNSPLGAWLANSSYDLAADLLKVPHHGTEGCAPDAFFDRVGAKVAFVPGPQGLWASDRSKRIRDYFAVRSIPTYVSGIHGNVTVTLDASGYSIAAERPGSG